jgi:hypothetical protein
MTPDMLISELRRWHAQAKKADAGTDLALNDPAPYARVRIADDDGGRPGTVLAEVVLTARHADDLASCLTSPTAFASADPAALASWLGRLAWAHTSPACWFVTCDAAGEVEGSVPLDAPGVSVLADRLSLHQTWLFAEQIARAATAISEGARVMVTGTASHLRGATGECGVVVRAKLVDIEPNYTWAYDVRLDDVGGGVQTFTGDELELQAPTA